VNKQPKVYLEGGGIESLAAKGGYPGENISILEAAPGCPPRVRLPTIRHA
jgi:hypothetical protein